MLITRHPPSADRIWLRRRLQDRSPAWYGELTRRLAATESPSAFVALYALWAPCFVVASLVAIARAIYAATRDGHTRRPPPALGAGAIRRLELPRAHSRGYT